MKGILAPGYIHTVTTKICHNVELAGSYEILLWYKTKVLSLLCAVEHESLLTV